MQDDLAIGVDNDPSTFFRPPASSASIFLNCLMYKELQAMVYLAKCLNCPISALNTVTMPKILFGKDYQQNGALHEYYEPDTGAPIVNKGFQNWNYLVLNMIDWLKGSTVISEF